MSVNSKRVRVNHVDLNLIDIGHGAPTLLFLHYWGGSASTWSDTIERLSASHRCIAFDFRGWGESSKGSLDYGLDALASDTLALIEQLGLATYILVGHSMGGKVAQIVAAKSPKGLLGLVLVAPAPPTPLQTPREARHQIRASLDTREGVFGVLPMLAHGDLKKEHQDLVIQNSIAGDPGAKDYWLNTGMDIDITSLTSNVEAPMTVVVGGSDVVEPEEALRNIFGRYYPGARFVVIKDSGHLIPLQGATELADAISETAANLGQ